MLNTNLTVVGSVDGVTPVYEPNGRWCYWEFEEIFSGTTGTSRYVPKVGDFVVDRVQFITYEVIEVSPVTLLSTLAVKNPPIGGGGFTDSDLLLGVGPGTQSDTYRVYVDKSVTPHILAVDRRLKIGGSTSSYVKIYRGSNVSLTGLVISRLYDNAGNFIDEKIPLELASIENTTNHNIKIVAGGFTNYDLLDGEIVTAVVFAADNHVVSKRQLLVENTGFIRSVNVSQKYVASIALESPFLSGTALNLIEFPINIPVESMGLMGIVNYSDGSVVKMPVDGNKFKMLGLDGYIGTLPGQELDLVLTYSLSVGETAYGGVTPDGRSMTRPYHLKTMVQNGSYTVRVFPMPVWMGTAEGYSLRWFMTNLDRTQIWEVTNFITFNISNGSFNPKAYGTLQRKSVSLNLRDVSGVFKSYIHTQTIDITLLAQGTARTTNWTINNVGQTPPYGIGLFAEAQMITASDWRLRIKSGLASQPIWLDRLYNDAKPLVSLTTELVPPIPNMFIIVAGGIRQEYSIRQWDSVLTVGAGLVIDKTLRIEWIKRTTNGDLKLAVTSLPIYDALLI